MKACYYAVDKKSIDELPLDMKEKILLKKLLKTVKGTDVETLLLESGLINKKN